MFEESSKQGCLNSSYLLWENNRKVAVSNFPFYFSQSTLIMSGPFVICKEHTWCIFLRSYLPHNQEEH